MRDEKKPTQADLEAMELVYLLKSGEYPRSLLENNDPDIVDADKVIAAFSRAVKKEGRYSFLSQSEAVRIN